MGLLIEGEQVVMKVHTSRITHAKLYLLAILLFAIPLTLFFLEIKLPIPAAYANYVNIVPVALAVLLLAILEISIRRSVSYITNYRVMNSRGVFKKTYDSCTYDKMVNVKVIQSFPQRILRVGTIDITAFQRSEITLNSIHNPSKVERTIYNMIQKTGSASSARSVQISPAQPALPENLDSGKK